MVGPIHWGSYDGQTLERVMALLLFQERPNAWHRTPSSGDGGVDVVNPVDGQSGYHVFQVKGFIGRLTSSRRRQIEHSLTLARDEPRLNRPIVKWTVTFPTDLTSAEEEWFQTLTTGIEFPCDWKGALFWDSEASKYPYVIDYCLRDGKDRLLSRVRTLGDLLQRADKPILPVDLVGSLSELHRELNSSDPHYRYDLRVNSEPPSHYPMTAGLVMTQTAGSPESSFVTIDVIARYPQATEDRPIGGTLSISTTGIADQIADFVGYGRELVLPEGSVDLSLSGVPGGLEETTGSASAKLGPAYLRNFRPHKEYLKVVADDGLVVAQLNLNLRYGTSGSSGIEFHGSDTDEVCDVTIRVEFPKEASHARANLMLSLRDWSTQPAVRLRNALHFFDKARAPARLDWYHELMLDPMHSGDLPADPIVDVPASFVRVVEALAAIQQYTPIPLHLPEELTPELGHHIEVVHRLLMGERLVAPWDEGELSVPEDDARGLLDDLAAGRDLCIEEPLRLQLPNMKLSIGQVVNTIEGATLASQEGLDGAVLLRLRGTVGAMVTAQLKGSSDVMVG